MTSFITVIHPCNTLYTWPVIIIGSDFTHCCHSPLPHPANMATVISTSLITVIHLRNTQQTCPVISTSLITVIHFCNTQQTWPQSYQLHLSLSFTSATPSKHAYSHINFTYHCHSPLQHPANMASHTGSYFTYHCRSPLLHSVNMVTVILVATSLMTVTHLCNSL